MVLQVKSDADWVRHAFLVPKTDLDPQSNDFRNRIFSSTSLKYTDTSPGGNICINPPPQPNTFADPAADNPFVDTTAFLNVDGMSRYYGEAIDDNSQIIHMRFGVEQYNSLTQFFTGFYNSSAGMLARTGRTTDVFYLTGKAVGFVVQLASWKLLAVHFLGAAFNFLTQKPTSKFYYSKPSMPLYYNAVTTMLNHLAVNRGIVPRALTTNAKKFDPDYTFDSAGMAAMAAAMPGVFNSGGGVDVYALANKAKRKERARMEILEKVLDNAGNLSGAALQAAIQEAMRTPIVEKNKGANLIDYLKSWFSSSSGTPKASGSDTNETTNTTESVNYSPNAAKQDGINGVGDFLQAEWDDGAAFASFRVNATGQVSESFSSSVADSELQGKINGMAGQAREANFSFANGNILGGVAGAVLGQITSAVQGFAAGALDSVGLSGLAAIGGGAFIDIPKHWVSSMANLPKSTYTMDLVSPYGNPISQLLNIDLPMCMILAGGLPKSTGKQSYVGPFLVELYDRGRCQTRLGMIDSIQITRGVGNVGFNQDGKSLGATITFSVVDMSSILAMPLTENFGFVDAAAQAVGKEAGGATGQAIAAIATGSAFDDDSVYSDYLAVLSGMALNDQIYAFRKLKLNLTRSLTNYKSWTSISHLASFLGDTFPSRIIGAFYRGSDIDSRGTN